MKNRILFSLLFILTYGISTYAQGDLKDRTIYLEVGGASNTVGVVFDSRFLPTSNWGYGIGVSYAYSSSSDFIFDHSTSTSGFTVPLNINYLAGNFNHNLELGLGVNLGYYRAKTAYSIFEKVEDTDPPAWVLVGEEKERRNTFGYFLFANVGYRYTSDLGLNLRIGLSPSFDLGGKYAVSKSFFYPYISVGYTF